MLQAMFDARRLAGWYGILETALFSWWLAAQSAAVNLQVIEILKTIEYFVKNVTNEGLDFLAKS